MKKAKTEQVTIVAYRLAADGEGTEVIKVDNLRAVEGETTEQAKARATRLEWARRSLRQWSPVGVSVTRMMSDGSEASADYAEVRATLDAPDGAVPIASLVAPASPEAPKATAKGKRKAKASTEAPTVEASTALVKIEREIVDATPMQPRYQSVFTIGYEGGLTLETLKKLVEEHRITRIVDTRQNTRCKNPSFTGTMLARLEEVYVCAPSEREVFAAIERFVTREGRSILLLRKEESPCESPYHLQLARRVAMTHLFRDEAIDGASLQAALDADERDPSVDHPYECVKDIPDDAQEQAS